MTPKQDLEPMPQDMTRRPSAGFPGAPAASRRGVNALKVAAIAAEIAILPNAPPPLKRIPPTPRPRCTRYRSRRSAFAVA